MTKIEEIKERHSKVGGTPWKASEYSTDYYKQGYMVKTWNDGEIANCIEEKGEVDFIANAPSDIAYLLTIIEQAEKALEWFANEEIYKVRENDDNPFDIKPEIVVVDGLHVANSALKTIRNR